VSAASLPGAVGAAAMGAVAAFIAADRTARPPPPDAWARTRRGAWMALLGGGMIADATILAGTAALA
jgi:hypothetical protein